MQLIALSIQHFGAAECIVQKLQQHAIRQLCQQAQKKGGGNGRVLGLTAT